jgi:plastocyanin
MRRLALTLAIAVALAVTGRAAAMDEGGPPPVDIEFASYAPPQIQVLAGDTVTWQNMSSRAHTVSAVDGTWSSAHIAGGDMFTHRFDATGAYAYYCQIHPFMRGEVDVERLLLNPPSDAVAPGRPFLLTGRAALPPGTTLALEEDSGAGPQSLGSAMVAGDGTFEASVIVHASGALRAVAGSDASPPVQVLVLDRTVTASATRHGRRSVVRVHVSPASPGSTVVLQLHLRERFGWWPVRHARLDSASNARFRLRLHRRVKARVVLTLRDRATVLAVSRTLRIGSRR